MHAVHQGRQDWHLESESQSPGAIFLAPMVPRRPLFSHPGCDKEFPHRCFQGDSLRSFSIDSKEPVLAFLVPRLKKCTRAANYQDHNAGCQDLMVG